MEQRALKAILLFLADVEIGRNSMCPNFYLGDEQYEHGIGPETECCKKICHESLGSSYFYKQKNNWNRCPCRVLGQERLVMGTKNFLKSYYGLRSLYVRCWE